MLARNNTEFAIVANHLVALEKAGGSEADFRLSIRAAVRGLWSGQLDIFGFLESLNNAIHRGYTNAWNEGLAAVGIRPDEMTAEERSALYSEMNTDLIQTWGFASSISAGSKANGGKLNTFLKRAEMWTNRYRAVVGIAMMIAGRDKKLKWVWSPEKEHCGSCARLQGRVYRASTWARYDLRPRMRRLECRGFRCGCRFEVTTDPVTPGKPPAI